MAWATIFIFRVRGFFRRLPSERGHCSSRAFLCALIKKRPLWGLEGQGWKMRIKRVTTIIVLMCSMFSAVGAQELATDAADNNSGIYEVSADSSATMNDAATTVSDADDESLRQKVWNRRAKYFNISYGMQKVKSSSRDVESDMAFALTFGRTYYLHKKPIGGVLKFGLDWSFIDVNFAKYPDFPSSADASGSSSGSEQADLGIMQLEAGMGIGPSVTVNPVGQLKVNVYFHVTPSFSMMVQNSELYTHYATFFNAGLAVSYKAISLGEENRWCGAINYDGVTLSRLDNIYDSEGNFHDPFENIGQKMKTNTFRVFIGFRF